MKWRYLLWMTMPGLLMLLLMWRNTNVSDLYHLQRVQPFVLMSLAKILLIAVLVVQHPPPAPHIPRWHVWRWVDPLTAMLVTMLGASALYFLMLWGGNSQQFRAPDWGYTIARMVMWLDGYLLLMAWMEILYRAIQSRKAERRRHLERYDLGDSSGGER